MNIYIKNTLIALFSLIILFGFFYTIAKNVIPDLLGSTNTVDETMVSISAEKLLNKKAPTFNLSDIVGNRVSIEDFQGKPVVIVFWATWNKEASDQIKIFNDYLLSANIQNTLIKVIGIDSLEDLSIVKSFTKRGGYTVPIVLDISGNVSGIYNVKSLPTTYFVDRDGIIVEKYSGVLSEAMIVDKVENLLK